MHRSQRFAVLISGIALLTFAAMLTPETVRKPPPPEPTSDTLLAVFDAWGAKYKLNEHGQVDWLWLKRLPLSDDDLQLLTLVPQLKYLNMRGINTIEGNHFTDAGLKPLSKLEKLEHLNLSANHFLTDDCSQWLAEIPSLRVLNLCSTKLTEASLPNLSRLPRLQSLGFSYYNHIHLTEKTLPFFQKMPLRKLTGVRIEEEDRHLVAELRSLEVYPADPIDSIQALRDIDLVHLRHLSQMTHRTIELTKGWRDAGQLRHLQAWPKLKNLRIVTSVAPGKEIDYEGIAELGKIASLERLEVSHVNDDVLTALSHCRQILLLDLTPENNEFTPKGLSSLQPMTNLKALTLPRKSVNDEALITVSEITSLQVLGLDGRSLFHGFSTDAPHHPEKRMFEIKTLGALSNLPHLKSLYLDGWDLADEALGCLGRIETLEKLSVGDNAIRGSGVSISEPGLLQLRRLSHLKYLNFYGTSTSMQAAERLHEIIPDCYITDNWCCGCMEIGPFRDYAWVGSLNFDP